MTIVNEISKHFADYPVFTSRDIMLYLRRGGRKPGNLTRLISYMKSSGKLYAVKKGVYSFRKDNMLSGFAYSPFYYGLLSAMTVREMWTQHSRPEIMTVRKVRKSRTHIFGDEGDVVFIHHIPPKYFFGYDIVKYGQLKIPVSDPEKTLIDMFYYRVKLPLQDYSGLLKAVNYRKVRKYLRAYGRRTSTLVLGFLKEYKPLADSGKLESPY